VQHGGWGGYAAAVLTKIFPFALSTLTDPDSIEHKRRTAFADAGLSYRAH
jgi:hypothetical protein